MALSNEEILNLIKTPQQRQHLQRAIQHQRKLQFHAKIETEKSESSTYAKEYLRWVETVLTAKDKYKQFVDLFTYPVATNDVIDTISDEYLRLFNAQDSFFDVHLSGSDQAAEYLDYLSAVGCDNFFSNEVFGAMLTAINSLVVVDLLPQQIGEKPKPYFYLLDISEVIDVQYDTLNNRITYAIFTDGKDIVVIDDENYRRYAKLENSHYQLKIQNPHDIGYCPVSFMWDDNLDANNPYLKQSPISGQLARLDWYLFMATAKKSLDIYASYPIYWSYKSKCQYTNEEGMPCEEGYTTVTQGCENPKKVACPSCEAKKLVGPGSIIQVPTPRNPHG